MLKGIIKASELEKYNISFNGKVNFQFGFLYGIKFTFFIPCYLIKAIISKYFEFEWANTVLIQIHSNLNPLYFVENSEIQNRALFFEERENLKDIVSFFSKSIIIVFNKKLINSCIKLLISKNKSLLLLIHQQPKSKLCSIVYEAHYLKTLLWRKIGLNEKLENYKFRILHLNSSKA